MNRFRLVYIAIAIATATHTSWGAATTMQGEMPTDPFGAVWWWFGGLLFAIAIDATMVLTADRLREKNTSRRWLMLTFFTAACLSAFFQLVYAYHHASDLSAGKGVTEGWAAILDGIIAARIVVVPLALPLMGLFYALGGFSKPTTATKRPALSERPLSSPRPVVTVSSPELDIPGVPLLDEQVSGGQDKRAVVHAYLDMHPEAISWSARRLEALTGVSKSTCNNVLKERRS